MNNSNSKLRKMVLVDILLIPSFILLILSGIMLHRCQELGVGHVDAQIWSLTPHHWIMIHIITSIVAIIHIYYHWSWYKSLVEYPKKKRSIITVLLSATFLLGLITSLFVDASYFIGKLHYILGLLIMVFAIIHLISRFKWLVRNCLKIFDIKY